MTEPPRRSHREILEEALPLPGARVADVGCGDGTLAREMARAGARVVGIEPSAAQLARARAVLPATDEVYVRAVAEALPLARAVFDVVVFFNALHHVPVAHQDTALCEAGCVLRPGGLLYVVEPLAAGPHFQVMRPVEDESQVRAKAYAALCAAAAGRSFAAARELTYVVAYDYDDFAAFAARLVAVNEARRCALEAHRDEVTQRFHALSVRADHGYCLDQPCRLTLLRRR